MKIQRLASPKFTEGGGGGGRVVVAEQGAGRLEIHRRADVEVQV